jgi:hypothetical protein
MDTYIQEQNNKVEKKKMEVKEKPQKKSRVYQEMKELQKELFELKMKLMNRDMEITNLKKEKEIGLETKKKLDEIKFIGEQFSNKLGASMSLMKTLNNYYGKYGFALRGGVTGSLIRQVLEVPFALQDCFKDNGFGNPDAHDIDIVLEKYVTEEDKKNFGNILKLFTNELSTYIKFQNNYPDVIEKLKIDKLTIVDIYETTITEDIISQNDSEGKKRLVNIPHVIIKAIDSNKKVYTFDVLAYMPDSDPQEIWSNGDFDVNTLMFTRYGIESTNNYSNNLFEILEHMRKKEATCRINLEEYQNKIMAQPLTRSQKIPYLKQIAFYLANRTKILAYGYKDITSNFKVPCITLETKEDCFITACAPPYLKVELVCGHELSVMAYTGEVIRGKNEFNEGIKCPLCRGNLLIKFKDNLPTSIKTFEPTIKEKKKEHYPEEKNPLKQKLYSEDSEKYLMDLFHSKEDVLPIIGDASRSVFQLQQLNGENMSTVVIPPTERRDRGTMGESS